MSEVRGPNEPLSSRFSKTSRETRFWKQVTPFQVQRSVVSFHEVSLLALSEADLKSINGCKSGFGMDLTKKNKRKKRRKCKSKQLGFAILRSARSRESKRERGAERFSLFSANSNSNSNSKQECKKRLERVRV